MTQAIKRKKVASFDTHFSDAEECSSFFVCQPASQSSPLPLKKGTIPDRFSTTKKKTWPWYCAPSRNTSSRFRETDPSHCWYNLLDNSCWKTLALLYETGPHENGDTPARNWIVSRHKHNTSSQFYWAGRHTKWSFSTPAQKDEQRFHQKYWKSSDMNKAINQLQFRRASLIYCTKKDPHRIRQTMDRSTS